jgi:hypothetical protein
MKARQRNLRGLYGGGEQLQAGRAVALHRRGTVRFSRSHRVPRGPAPFQRRSGGGARVAHERPAYAALRNGDASLGIGRRGTAKKPVLGVSTRALRRASLRFRSSRPLLRATTFRLLHRFLSPERSHFAIRCTAPVIAHAPILRALVSHAHEANPNQDRRSHTSRRPEHQGGCEGGGEARSPKPYQHDRGPDPEPL